MARRAQCPVRPSANRLSRNARLILHRLVGLGLAAAILALASLAYASPPDQTWIAGLYDSADFDDVILCITSRLSAVQPSLASLVRVVAQVVGLVTPMDTTTRPLLSLSSDLCRAPPLA